MEVDYDSSARGNAANIPGQGQAMAAQNYFIQNDQTVGDTPQGISDDLESWNPMEDDFTNLAFNAYREPTTQELRQWMPKPGGGGPSEDLLAIYRSRDGDVRLFVNGIPNEMTQEGLQGLFSQVGKLVYCKVIPQRDPSRIDKFGFVGYKSYREAEHAIRKFDGFPLGKNMKLKVSLAKEKPKFPDTFPMMDDVDDDDDNIANSTEEDSENKEQGWGPPATPLSLATSMNGNPIEPQGQGHTPAHPDQERGITEATACNGEVGIQVVSKKPIGTVLEPLPCSKCGKDGRRRCSNCKIPYCSKECQRSHWPEHRTFCNWKSTQAKPERNSAGSAENTESVTPSNSQTGSDDKNENQEQSSSKQVSAPTQDSYSLNEDDFDISEISQFANLMGIRMVPRSPSHSPSLQNCELDNNQRRSSGSGRGSPVPSPQESHYGFLQPLKKASTKPLITEISSSVPEPVGSRGGSSRSTPVMDDAPMSSGTSSPAISTQSEYQTSIISANEKQADEPQHRPHKRYFVNEVPHQNVSIGGSYEFVVTSASSPTLFWAQLYEESALASQNYLFETIKAEYENTPYKTYVPSPNELCIAQFSLDNNWYRSKVDYIANNGLIRVTHIDFGSSEDVDPTKIRRILEDLVRVPRQGVKCALHFPECLEMSREWSLEEIQAFRSRVLDVKCRVEVKDIKDSVLQVNMFDSKDNSRINDIFKDEQKARANVVKPVPVYPQCIETLEQLSSLNSINPHESSSARSPLLSTPLRVQDDSSSSRGSSPAPPNIAQAPAIPVTRVPAIARTEDPTSIPQAYSTNVQSNRISPMLDSGSAFLPVQMPLTEPSGSAVRNTEPFNQESQSFFSEVQMSPETYYSSASHPKNSNPSPGNPLPEQESVRSTPSQSSSKSSSEVEFQVRSPESPMQRTTGVVHGLPFKGVVTSVKSPWEFHVNLLDPQLAEQLDQLTYELNKYCSSAPFDVQKFYTHNELCAVKLKDDGTWHRGKVIANFEDGSYKIVFIDLGGEKVLAPQNLRALPEQFQIVEPRCRVCSLGGVRKPARSVVWGREANERFSSLVLHRTFTFKEINRYKHTYLVDVLNEAGQPSVAVELINAGLADPFIRKVQRIPDLKEKARPMAAFPFPLPVKFAITSAKLPPLNTTFQIMATDIQSPASFSVQLVDKETNQSLSDLCAEMNKYYADSTAHPDWKPRQSEMCATFLKGSWFRAHIGNVNQDNAALIYCVDFGNSEVVSTSVMRPLAPMFHNLPYCALRCSLGNISPPEGDEWSNEATDFLKLRVPISSTLNARLIFKGQSILFLDVFVASGKGVESIVKLLVAKGLAKFKKKEVSSGITEMPKDRVEGNLGPFKTGISPYGLSIQGCAIAAAKLPNETETFQGIVTEMKPTGELYVQIADETLAVQLMELTRAMNIYYTNAIPTKFEAKQNLLCAAQFFTDWRRAYILGINSSETVTVYDVDFGKTETVHFSQLQFLQPQFMTLQYCALQCKVSLPRGIGWTKDACDLFVSKVNFHVPTTIRLISKRKEILFIDFLIAESSPTLVQMIISQSRERNPIPEGSNRVPKPSYLKSPPKKKDTGRERTVKSLNFERAIAAASLPHVGQTFDAVITEYQSPHCFYIQSDFQMAKRLETLSTEMNNYYNAVPKSPFQPVENQHCVALFGAPNEWYRALIEKINSNQTATIFYVDYGNTRDVPMADLRQLQDRFSELPYCALNTSLANVTPTDPSGWTSEANNFAKSRLQVSVRLCLKLVSKRQDVLYVDWVNPATAEASLCSDMVSNGYAHSSGSEDMPPTRSRSSPGSSQKLSPSRREDAVASGNVPERSPSISRLRSSQNPIPSPQESAIASANLPPFKETFQVIATHITSPGSFAVQIADFEMARKVAELGKDMTAHYRSAQHPSFSPAANQLCAAHFTGNNEWYRGWIESISSDNKAHVYYPDYGNSEDLHVSRLRPLEPQFASLSYASLPCSIAHVVPPDQAEWKQEAIDVFNSSIPLYHPINVKLVFRQRDRLFLDITDPNDNSTTLSKTFVERGLAVWMVSKRQNNEATDCSQAQSQVFGAHGVNNLPNPAPMTTSLNPTNQGTTPSQVFGAYGVNNLPNPAPMTTSLNPTNQGTTPSQVFGAHGVNNLPNPAPMTTSLNPTNQGTTQSQVFGAYGVSNMPNPAPMTTSLNPTNQGTTQSQVFGAHGVNNLPNPIQVSNHPIPTNKSFLQSLPMVAFPINEFFNAMVCDIKNTGAVSLQVLTQELKDLDPLCMRIGNHCSQIDHSPYCPMEGELCLACFSQDKNWYRAVVTGVLPNNQYQVTFVDYGNDDTISPNDIRKVEPEFLRLPRQAYTGVLAGLPRSPMGVMLEDNVVRALSAKLLEKRVFARVNGSTNEVEFFDVGTDDKPATSINQELL